MNNVIRFLDDHRQRVPEKIALEWVPPAVARTWDGRASLPHERITYAKLATTIEAAAGGLRRLGLTKGDRVLIFVPLSVELYVSMFAAQQIGAIPVFLDSWARRDQLGLCARTAAPKGMISLEPAFELSAGVPDVAAIPVKVVVGDHRGRYAASLSDLITSKSPASIEPVEAEHPALVTFTTGSSGTPKGANRTHGFLAAQHAALQEIIPYTPQDKDMPVFPIFSLNNLASGVTTVLPAIDLAAPSSRDAAVLTAQIRQAGVTCCTVSPSIFEGVSDFCARHHITLDGLRRVVTGGAPVSRDQVARFKVVAPSATALILYGSTEVEPIAHIDGDTLLSGSVERDGVNVGAFSSSLRWKFLRLHRGPIALGPKGWAEWETAAGTPGELAVSGPHVCGQYYNNQDAFRETKIVDAAGAIWHRTGDVGLLDPEGDLWLVGRVHNAIARDGNVFFPVQAEIVMKRLAGVRQAAYVGLPDPALGERAVAVVSLKENVPDQGTLRRAVEDALAACNLPVDDVRVVQEIPMDPRHHSKVEYTTLRRQL